MQIDFHHAVTYVTARIAGFTHAEADVIAYAAQYVDDATCDGTICFDNKALYQRISSAHKAIDPKNMDALENQKVWMPFHFLPGNGSADPGDSTAGKFIHKLVCLPDSPIARDMLDTAFADRDKPYALHRLGIAMHVYADTWAHQGFAGVLHQINDVDDFDEIGTTNVFEDGLKGFINRVLEKSVPPLGHGKANIFPDMPFLSWRYRNGHGKVIERHNTEEFCTAANALCRVMQRYRGVPETGIGQADQDSIKGLFVKLAIEDGNKRHEQWLAAIATGNFSFGPATVSYADRGKKSWKAAALGDADNHLPTHEYHYSDAFLASNWKLFHDALQLHRLTVAHDILPKYGICAA